MVWSFRFVWSPRRPLRSAARDGIAMDIEDGVPYGQATATFRSTARSTSSRYRRSSWLRSLSKAIGGMHGRRCGNAMKLSIAACTPARRQNGSVAARLAVPNYGCAQSSAHVLKIALKRGSETSMASGIRRLVGGTRPRRRRSISYTRSNWFIWLSRRHGLSAISVADLFDRWGRGWLWSIPSWLS
jgi:hypothetical protein